MPIDHGRISTNVQTALGILAVFLLGLLCAIFVRFVWNVWT